MNSRVDVRLEALTAKSGLQAHSLLPDNGRDRTFYLETFGCQMNDHDSEKVAGVLIQRGYRQVEDPETAGLVLYNTCSIREKAAHKVFSRLGLYRDANEGKIIGVLGCVAQQEGEVIF
jgi:tRNA-2-methylthio-N6-dimethylallyladenosine synthase